MNDEAIYRFLGLGQRAGYMLSGSQQLRDGLKNRKGKLLIITEDTSERTRKELTAMAERYCIEWRLFGNKDDLGRALGKGVRTAVLITDGGFGRAVRSRLDAGHLTGEEAAYAKI